jgi:hypothetical protein
MRVVRLNRTPGPTWVFAFNLDMSDEARRARRIPLARAVLTRLGAPDER